MEGAYEFVRTLFFRTLRQYALVEYEIWDIHYE